jgi:hypothetical protein
MLIAIGLVVLLVSLPRLREFALRENEEDARVLVQRLAALASNEVQAAERVSVESLLSADPNAARQVDDAEFLDGGKLLRRHGYLFEVGPSVDGTLVRAWPWEWRKTGSSAYVWTSKQALVAHPNDEGRWSGLSTRPRWSSDPAWRDLVENP